MDLDATTGQRERFETMFSVHHRAVRDFVVRRAPAPLVDDIVADTFLVAWRRIEEIDQEPLPWLLAVARRTLANQLRSARRRDNLADRLRVLSGPVVMWEPPDSVPEDLGRALAELPEQEREALLLVAWEELTPIQAAEVLGCSPATFRMRLYRARRRVAAGLGGTPPREDQPRVDHAAEPTPCRMRLTEELP